MSLIKLENIKKSYPLGDEMLEILAIAESTPGPIAINMATYIGYLKGKVLGSIAATIGVVLPSLIIIYVISLFFDAFYAIESVDFGLAIEFYSDLIAKEKEAFVDFMSTSKEIVNGIPLTTISAAEAEVLYDAIVLLTFPVLVIIAFLITGLAFKTFSLNLKHFSENKEKISSWHFGTNNLLAYFYIIISIVNIFTSYSDEIYAIVITFIALVLSVIYAYLGFKFLFWIFKRRFNPILCFVVVVLLFSLFGNTVVNILSFVGVYYTIASNNMFSKGTPKSHN